MTKFLTLCALVAGALSLNACVETGLEESKTGPKYALAELVTNQIRRCWYGAGRTAFSAYAAESDINPVFNRARILLLKKDDLEGKPVLIIESTNKNTTQATISAYGPLMQGPQGARITNDLKRWTGGSQACN